MPRRIIGEPGAPEIISPDRKLLRLLGTVPVKQVRCRSGKHKWASEEQEDPRDPFPDEVVAHPRAGCYLIDDPCLRCDAVKHTLTGEGGDLYTARSWITYPHDWVTIPSEFPHGKATFKMEWNRLTRQSRTRLYQEADREQRKLEREEARAARAIHPVTFSGTG